VADFTPDLVSSVGWDPTGSGSQPHPAHTRTWFVYSTTSSCLKAYQGD